MKKVEIKETIVEEAPEPKAQEAQETVEGTYSRAFEEFERSQIKNPGAELFFKMLKTMSTEYQDEKAEETRQLFSVADKFKENIQNALSTPEGTDLFKKEIERRVGKIKGDNK